MKNVYLKEFRNKMSFELKLDRLSIDTRKKIMSDLKFEQINGTNDNNIKNVYAYEVKNKNVIVPKYYSVHKLNIKDDEDKVYQKINIIFNGELYAEQKSARNECIDALNKYKSCILSLPVGCGKCLSPETKVIMYDGTIKKACNIIPGDILMGDDGNSRIVLSTVRGQDDMYSIINSEYNVHYTVNSEHILTLVNITTNKIEDIPLKYFLKNPSLIGIIYKGFRVSVDTIGNMTRNERMMKINQYFSYYNTIDIYDENTKNEIEFLARSLGLSLEVSEYNTNGTKWWSLYIRSGKNDIYPFVIKYDGLGDYCGFELSGNGRFLLSDFTVTHNTATAINLSTKIQLKTLIIVNRLVLMKQWEESILKFSPSSKIYIIKPPNDNNIPLDYDFYLINAINVSKYTRQQLSFIGFCIIDECHMIMSEVLSQCLWKLNPKYLIGLSASPYRLDGLDSMINVYFGDKKITKRIERSHVVYKVNTNFTPEVQYNRQGKLDWNYILNSQCSNIDRNKLIVSIVKKHNSRYFLLLTKRLEQANMLAKMLSEESIEYDCLYGTNVYVSSDKHVLIGTTGKCGVGFDAPKLDTLVVCCDMVNYYIQMLGRVMRNKDSQPWVFDLVDNHPTLLQHYYKRCKVYKENGGTIEKYII